MCQVPLAYVAEVASVTQRQVVNGWVGNTVCCRTMIQTPMKGFPHFTVFLEAVQRQGWNLGPVPEQMVCVYHIHFLRILINTSGAYSSDLTHTHARSPVHTVHLHGYSAYAWPLPPIADRERECYMDTEGYLAAVLKYLAPKTLELASNAIHNNKKQHIMPRHL